MLDSLQLKNAIIDWSDVSTWSVSIGLSVKSLIYFNNPVNYLIGVG